MARDHQVSRKFVYQQVQAAEKALGHAITPVPQRDEDDLDRFAHELPAGFTVQDLEPAHREDRDATRADCRDYHVWAARHDALIPVRHPADQPATHQTLSDEPGQEEDGFILTRP